MSLKRYGVWVVKPESYDAQTPRQDSKSPHITLKFADNGSGGSAEINVKSLDSDKRLVYWVNRNFTHPITSDLDNLNLGLRNITKGSKSDLALDFQRTQPALFNVESGQILPSYAKGPNNDILDKLEPILNQAIKEKATMYIYGQSYHDSDGMDGIHDIHMNQGNDKGFENSIYSDGSFFVKFQDGHWEAVFLAFASQALPRGIRLRVRRGLIRFLSSLDVHRLRTHDGPESRATCTEPHFSPPALPRLRFPNLISLPSLCMIVMDATFPKVSSNILPREAISSMPPVSSIQLPRCNLTVQVSP